jgi:two-component system, cell cycle sensor histidine kinase and response regulator CckA
MPMTPSVDPATHPDSMVRAAYLNRAAHWARLPVTLVGAGFFYVYTGAWAAFTWLTVVIALEIASRAVRNRLIAGEVKYDTAHLACVLGIVACWIAFSLMLWREGGEMPLVMAATTLLTVALFGAVRGFVDRRILFAMTIPPLVTLFVLMAIYLWQHAAHEAAVLGIAAAAVTCGFIYGNGLTLHRADLALQHANATREQLTKDLSKSKQFLEEVSDVSQIGGWQVDVATRALVWSPLVSRIFERDTDDAPDLEAAIDRFPPGARERVRAKVDNGLARGTPWVFEEPFITEKGRRIWVRGIGKPLYENGVLTELVGSFQDITERIANEEKLRRAEKFQAMGQLSGGIAHDLNNLLTAIVSAADVIDGGDADPSRTQAVATIKTAAQRAGGLTQSLLAYARQQVLAPQNVDLNAIVTETVGLARPMMPQGVDVTLDLDPRAPQVLLDTTQLSAAILNLVLNARDAMPDGGQLTVRTRSDGKAFVEVTDTGVGIAPDVLPHIFDPFFTTKDVGRGNGLGLSTVQGFVEQSGGRVTARSALGAGATFVLEFPSVDASATRNGAAAATLARAAPGDILLVEDDDLVRDALSAALRGAGHEVTAMANGPSALAAVDAGAAFDLLITDVVMQGGLSGPQLAAEVLARRPGAKMLLISGHARESLTDLHKLPAGATFIAKPFELAELQRKIAELLGENTMQAS